MLPDNVLFADGEGERIRDLLKSVVRELKSLESAEV